MAIDVDYLGPTRLPTRPVGPVRLGALPWSGGPPLTRIADVGMIVITGGTLANASRVAVRVAIQAVDGTGAPIGAAREARMAPTGRLTLPAPAPGTGWLIVAVTRATADGIVLGLTALGLIGLGGAVYGSYAAVRDLRTRWRARRARGRP